MNHVPENEHDTRRRPAEDNKGHIPRWLTIGIVAAFAAFTIIHIIIDIAATTYDGGTTSLMLGGLVGSALAGDRINANRSNDA